MTFADRIGRLDAAGDHAPLYKQLQRALREAIQKKVLSPDDALPAERDLADEFTDVGLMTGDVTINPHASCLVMQGAGRALHVGAVDEDGEQAGRTLPWQ